MAFTERRQLSRTLVKGLAYVNLDQNNGGTIVNISEGGLCFLANSPVRSTETIRFWFAAPNQQNESVLWHTAQNERRTTEVLGFVETDSELMWTDESQRRGGLRFTNLPHESRNAIRMFIKQFSANQSSLARGMPGFSFPPASGPCANGPRVSNTPHSHAVSARLDRLALVTTFRRTFFARFRAGFSGGLVTGVLLSAGVVGVFLLINHTRALGDSLIRLGERLGGRSWAAARESNAASLPNPNIIFQEPPAVSPAEVPDPAKRENFAGPLTEASTSARLGSAVSGADERNALNSSAASALHPSAPAISKAATLNAALSRPVVPNSVVMPASEPGPSIFGSGSLGPTPPKMELPSSATVLIAPFKKTSLGSQPEKFLEIGKFKEKLLADKTKSQIAQLGFPAMVLRRNHLFSKSYQVLVGPYGNEPEAEVMHKNLTVLGFTPRSYERGKRDFNLPPQLKVGRTRLPVGNCTISWESYSPDAIVRIEDIKGTSVTVEGKWMRQSETFPYDGVVFINNKDGSRTLLEIRFYRLGQTLVFGLT